MFLGWSIITHCRDELKSRSWNCRPDTAASWLCDPNRPWRGLHCGIPTRGNRRRGLEMSQEMLVALLCESKNQCHRLTKKKGKGNVKGATFKRNSDSEYAAVPALTSRPGACDHALLLCCSCWVSARHILLPGHLLLKHVPPVASTTHLSPSFSRISVRVILHHLDGLLFFNSFLND